MPIRPTIHCCRVCGAKCYRRVIGRDSSGALRSTSRYCCTGCSLSFGDPKEWSGLRAAQPDASPAALQTTRSAGVWSADEPSEFSRPTCDVTAGLSGAA